VKLPRFLILFGSEILRIDEQLTGQTAVSEAIRGRSGLAESQR
jgi:hypothetical protein